MELFEETSQNLSDSQLADMIERLFMSKDFLEKLDEYNFSSIVKGRYDEADAIRKRIAHGKIVIA
ncbi:MAG: hypothetical protein IJ158_00480 [Treponema sp.]|nr:hypothetical protein [Treponema sp.]